MGPHTTSDDPTRYRSRDEEEGWRRKDPLSRLRALLITEGLFDEAFEAAVDEAADAQASAMRAGCLALAPPDPSTLFDHVYAAPHPLLEEERLAFAEYHAGFDEA